MRFIPVELGQADPTILQPDPSRAFHLPPVGLPVQALKARKVADAAPRGDCLDIRRIADRLEVDHERSPAGA
jgi:hypothetical protein